MTGADSDNLQVKDSFSIPPYDWHRTHTQPPEAESNEQLGHGVAMSSRPQRAWGPGCRYAGYQWWRCSPPPFHCNS
jgi:hypothetical protein